MGRGRIFFIASFSPFSSSPANQLSKKKGTKGKGQGSGRKEEVFFFFFFFFVASLPCFPAHPSFADAQMIIDVDLTDVPESPYHSQPFVVKSDPFAGRPPPVGGDAAAAADPLAGFVLPAVSAPPTVTDVLHDAAAAAAAAAATKKAASAAAVAAPAAAAASLRPPAPRVVLSYARPTRLPVGPARGVLLPPLEMMGLRRGEDVGGCTAGTGAPAAATASGGGGGEAGSGAAGGAAPQAPPQRHGDAFLSRLTGGPPSVMGLSRRPFSRPQLRGVLARLRADKEGDEGGRGAVAAAPAEPAQPRRVVPSSLAFAALSQHGLVAHLLASSFTMGQAGRDFLLYGMMRREAAMGVFSTPPQVVLQLKRRAGLLVGGRDVAEAAGVVGRADRLWRLWRTHWMPRACPGCHDHVEAMVDRHEARSITDKLSREVHTRTTRLYDFFSHTHTHTHTHTQGGRLIRDRFVSGAGDLLLSPERASTLARKKMTIRAAVQIVLLSSEAHPAFVVWGAHDALSSEREYFVSFPSLSDGIDVVPSTAKCVFVRTWAVPFVDLPERFAPPVLDATSAATVAAAARALPPPPAAGAPKPQAAAAATDAVAAAEAASVVWLGEPCRVVGSTRYYAAVQSHGNRFDVGSDCYVKDSTRATTGKAVADSKVIGRVCQISDEGPGTDKVVVLRQWLRIPKRNVQKMLTKGELLREPSDWEVLGSPVLKKGVRAYKLQPASVRASIRLGLDGASLPELPAAAGNPLAENAAGYSPTVLAAARTVRPCPDESWPRAELHRGRCTLQLVASQHHDPGTKRTVPLGAAQEAVSAGAGEAHSPVPPERAGSTGAASDATTAVTTAAAQQQQPPPPRRKLMLRRTPTPSGAAVLASAVAPPAAAAPAAVAGVPPPLQPPPPPPQQQPSLNPASPCPTDPPPRKKLRLRPRSEAASPTPPPQ